MSPLVPFYNILNSDVTAERWRQHKTWRTQHQPDDQWDKGLAFYVADVHQSQDRRLALVKLIAFATAAVEDLDSRGQQPAATQQPPLDFDPEGSLR